MANKKITQFDAATIANRASFVYAAVDTLLGINIKVTDAQLTGFAGSFTANTVVYANGSSLLTNTTNFRYDGSTSTIGGASLNAAYRMIVRGVGGTTATSSLLLEDSSGNDNFDFLDDGSMVQAWSGNLDNTSTSNLIRMGYRSGVGTAGGANGSIIRVQRNGAISLNDNNFNSGTLASNQTLTAYFRALDFRTDRNNTDSSGLSAYQMTKHTGANNEIATRHRFNGASDNLYSVVISRISSQNATGSVSLAATNIPSAFYATDNFSVTFNSAINNIKAGYRSQINQTFSNSGAGVAASVGFYSQVSNGELNFSFLQEGNENFVMTANWAQISTAVQRAFYLQSGVAPSANVTDTAIMYVADILAGNAAFHTRTENGSIVKLYQETTSVAGAVLIGGGGTTLTDTDTFDGYTLAKVVKALRNLGILA